MTWLLLLCPLLFIIPHSLLGLLLIPLYGCESIEWRNGALEVVAKRCKNGDTRILFKPGAQTHGCVIFYASERLKSYAALGRHERIHILQSLFFGAFYLVTYLLWFAIAYALVKCRLAWWDRRGLDDDVWMAYRTIPWERMAYRWQ